MVAVLAKPIGGRISDRVGRKPVIVSGLMLCAGALPLIFHRASFGGLAAAVLLLGLGVAAVTAATNALIADLVAVRHLGAGMGVFGTLWDTGEAAGPIAAGFLIARLGYGPAFDAIAIVVAVAALAFAVLVHEPARRDADERAWLK